MSDDGEIITLFRTSLKIQDGNVSITEDSFQAESKPLIFKIKNPENLTGYKLKYVMRNKIGKVTTRPHDKADPMTFDSYAVYLDNKKERNPLLAQMVDEIENQLKTFQIQVNTSIANLVKFKREKVKTE